MFRVLNIDGPKCMRSAEFHFMLGFVDFLRGVPETMGMHRTLFTSESVTEGHPDKIADQISDAILDAVLAEDPVGRVACETLVTTGMAIIAGEITTKTYVDFPSIVRKTIKEIGYTPAKYGFDTETGAVISPIDPQSPTIAQGVHP